MIFIDKIKIKEKEFNIIKNNLENLKSKGTITQEDYDKELSNYEINKINFQHVISFIGTLLFIIGAGLFASMYWDKVDTFTKIIIGIITSSILVSLSYISRSSYSKISNLLLIINIPINIFIITLIQETYFIFDNISYMFLLIPIVILPTIKYLNSKFSYIILLLTMIPNIFTLYLNGISIFTNIIIYILYLLLFVFIIYFIETSSEKLKQFTVGIFLRTSIILYSLYMFIYNNFFDYETQIFCNLLFLVFAIIMYLVSFKYNKNIYKLIALLMIGILGVYFTDEYYLNKLFLMDSSNSLILFFKYIFSLLYLLFFIFNASKGSYISLFFIIILIFQYIDLSPITFILSGIIFLIGAFLIERKRKRGNADE